VTRYSTDGNVWPTKKSSKYRASAIGSVPSAWVDLTPTLSVTCVRVYKVLAAEARSVLFVVAWLIAQDIPWLALEILADARQCREAHAAYLA
jgi:hypothetical protein